MKRLIESNLFAIEAANSCKELSSLDAAEILNQFYAEVTSLNDENSDNYIYVYREICCAITELEIIVQQKKYRGIIDAASSAIAA